MTDFDLNLPLIDIKIDSAGGAGGPRVPAGVTGGNRPGTFVAGAQTEFKRKNVALGEAIQAETLRLIQARIDPRRRSVSTGRLLNVTASPQNLRVQPLSRIQVGIPEFLDKSQARYWRTFEEGSAATFRKPFIGTPLRFAGKRSVTPSAHGQTPGIRTATEGRAPQLFVTQEIQPRNAYRDAAETVPTRAQALVRAYIDDIRSRAIREF